MDTTAGFPNRVHYINHDKWKDTSKTGSICYYAVNFQA